MAQILAIDLNKFKSVTCLLDTDTSGTEFWTMSTSRHYLLTVLRHCNPNQVVIDYPQGVYP
jgi:transposase